MITRFALATLLAALAAGANAQAYDPCLVAGQEAYNVALARDKGEQLSHFLDRTKNDADSPNDREKFVQMAIAVFGDKSLAPTTLKEMVVQQCNDH